MSGTVTADNGVQLPLSDIPMTLAYATVGDNVFISTISLVYRGIMYIQSFTNNGAQITGISVWEAQS